MEQTPDQEPDIPAEQIRAALELMQNSATVIKQRADDQASDPAGSRAPDAYGDDVSMSEIAFTIAGDTCMGQLRMTLHQPDKTNIEYEITLTVTETRA